VAKLADGIRAFVTAAAGIALYFLGDRQGWGWVLAIVVVGFALGSACLLYGLHIVSRRPVAGVSLITGWTIALIAIGAAIVSVITLAAVTAVRELASLDESEAGVIGAIVVGAVTTFAGMVTDLQQGTWSVDARTRAALKKAFLSQFSPNTRPFEAVYEDRVGGSPSIKGWGFLARIRRAKAISHGMDTERSSV
jgi:hypothetical protein